MERIFFERALVLAFGAALGAAANAAELGDHGSSAGKSNLLLASAAHSMGTVRAEVRTLDGSKFTREASCVPSGGVTRAQMVLATATYLKQNPQYRGLPAGALLRQALRQAYPCPD